MKFTISPDENPGDPGAVHNGIVERDVNIKVATALVTALQRCGQDVGFDPNETFTQRIIKSNSDGTQVLVACAHNAAGSPAAEGAQFLFCGPAAHAFGHQQAAAEKCGAALVAGGLVQHWSTYDENVAECCDFNGDSVYVEFGFETNPTDAATIKQPDYPSRAAELLCEGLAATYGFPYASPVHPSAPPAEWKVNLVSLPVPLSGVLAAAVSVVNTVANEAVETLAAGTTLTVVATTRVRTIEYYVTQFSVDHATGYAIAKASVTFAQAQPAKTYTVVGGDGFRATGYTSLDVAITAADLYASTKLVIVNVNDESTGNSVHTSNPPAQIPVAVVTPANLPPTVVPTTVPPSTTSANFLIDLAESMVGFADHEIIALIEGALAELKKRAGV